MAKVSRFQFFSTKLSARGYARPTKEEFKVQSPNPKVQEPKSEVQGLKAEGEADRGWRIDDGQRPEQPKP